MLLLAKSQDFSLQVCYKFPQMNSKEAYRPVVTVEGVVKQNDIGLIKYILPGEDYQLEVLKTEGDYMSALDLDSKLPKGYTLVRVSTSSELPGKFGVDLKKIEPEGTISTALISGNIPSIVSENVAIPSQHQTDAENKPNPEVFRQRQEQKAENSTRNYFKEEVKVADSVPETDKEDSLGYFKALNLNAAELTAMTQEEASKKIKSGYRAAASVAHPDHGGTHDAMKHVNRAMEVISNPSLRSAYQNQTGQFAPQARP